jgi:hypothetical protein
MTLSQHDELIKYIENDINIIQTDLDGISSYQNNKYQINDKNNNFDHINSLTLFNYQSVLLNNTDQFLSLQDIDNSQCNPIDVNITSIHKYNNAYHCNIDPLNISKTSQNPPNKNPPVDLTAIPIRHRLSLQSISQLDHPSLLYSFPALLMHYNHVQNLVKIMTTNPTLRALIDHEFLVSKAILESLRQYLQNPALCKRNHKKNNFTTSDFWRQKKPAKNKNNDKNNDKNSDKNGKFDAYQGIYSIPELIEIIPLQEADRPGFKRLCDFILESFNFNDAQFKNGQFPTPAKNTDQIEGNFDADSIGANNQNDNNQNNNISNDEKNNIDMNIIQSSSERSLNKLGIYTNYNDAIKNSAELLNKDEKNEEQIAKLIQTLEMILTLYDDLSILQEAMFPWHPTPSPSSIRLQPPDMTFRSNTLAQFLNMGNKHGFGMGQNSNSNKTTDSNHQDKRSNLHIPEQNREQIQNHAQNNHFYRDLTTGQVAERLSRYVLMTQVFTPADYSIPINNY